MRVLKYKRDSRVGRTYTWKNDPPLGRTSNLRHQTQSRGWDIPQAVHPQSRPVWQADPTWRSLRRRRRSLRRLQSSCQSLTWRPCPAPRPRSDPAPSHTRRCVWLAIISVDTRERGVTLRGRNSTLAPLHYHPAQRKLEGETRLLGCFTTVVSIHLSCWGSHSSHGASPWDPSPPVSGRNRRSRNDRDRSAKIWKDIITTIIIIIIDEEVYLCKSASGEFHNDGDVVPVVDGSNLGDDWVGSRKHLVDNICVQSSLRSICSPQWGTRRRSKWSKWKQTKQTNKQTSKQTNNTKKLRWPQWGTRRGSRWWGRCRGRRSRGRSLRWSSGSPGRGVASREKWSK